MSQSVGKKETTNQQGISRWKSLSLHCPLDDEIVILKRILKVEQSKNNTFQFPVFECPRCRQLYTHINGQENQKKYSESLGSPSAFKDVEAAWAPEGFVKDVTAVLNSAVNIGFTNEKPAGFSGDDAGRMVQDLLAGTYDAQGFAEAYEKAWNEGF